MYSKYLRLLAITAVAIIVTLSMATSAVAYWGDQFYSLTDPGNTPPGNTGATNAPWVDLTAPPSLVVGQSIWFAIGNYHILANTKHWWVTVDASAGGTWSHSGATGYYNGGTSQSATTLTSSGVVPGPPLQQRWDFRSNPQPDWEVVKITRTSKGGIEDTVDVVLDGFSQCNLTGQYATGQTVTIRDVRYGGPTTNLEITEVLVYSEISAVDVTVAPTITAPPGSGPWSYEFVFVDENAEPLPQGGVRFNTAGVGVLTEQEFDVTFTMAGPAAGLYRFAAYDAVEGEYNTVVIPVTISVPALTEWGLLLLLALVLGSGIWITVRRKRRVTVGI